MCGIIAILLADEDAPACQLLYDGLTMLQHRGQDAAGIVTCDTRSRTLHMRKSNGLVKEVFQTEHMLRLEGCMGISHCRYPTAGSSSSAEAQPFYTNAPFGLCLAHNGNITNGAELLHDLRERQMRHSNTDSDSEALLNLFAEELASRVRADAGTGAGASATGTGAGAGASGGPHSAAATHVACAVRRCCAGSAGSAWGATRARAGGAQGQRAGSGRSHRRTWTRRIASQSPHRPRATSRRPWTAARVDGLQAYAHGAGSGHWTGQHVLAGRRPRCGLGSPACSRLSRSACGGKVTVSLKTPTHRTCRPRRHRPRSVTYSEGSVRACRVRERTRKSQLQRAMCAR